MVTLAGNRADFFFFRPHARRVCLVGDFNAWRHDEALMRRSGRWWTATLFLPDGKYRFRYIADGDAFTDYAAFGVEPGPNGFDSIILVDAAATTRNGDSSPECARCSLRGLSLTAAEVASLPPATTHPQRGSDPLLLHRDALVHRARGRPAMTQAP